MSADPGADLGRARLAIAAAFLTHGLSAIGAGSLRIGFAVPLVPALALLWLAKAFAPADEPSAGAPDRR